MKNDPSIIHMTPRWLKGLSECEASRDGNVYYPARPVGFASITHRIRAAWLVFTGQADALIWPGGQ
ncbi:hypothetical protein UFOVP1204_65 [uncultured Caudovirales phage]|uniref:Uncharacterized protein n=1 Tax=uncultured Caudovirales phage TaxID=2100421 RepID=A0A6J5Q2S7_9CAUD|nr:hypothetical protein UFOVP473_36 [uncultured Caudovirales phage]CAB4176566.1 hypothetical protein UFOVP983_36 [uncultured Caudovirales phage]CAB4190370.1 hypothetical protein UFOVP1204_65 [uncultured Caudovirales phage]